MPAPAFTVSALTHARGTTRVAATLLAAWIGGTTLGAAPAPRPQQQTTTPAISDSPTAQTLFDDVRTQSRENPAESARLARRLLDEYGNRVVRVGAESEDLFNSVSEETERFLLANPAVLERFRDMESRAAASRPRGSPRAWPSPNAHCAPTSPPRRWRSSDRSPRIPTCSPPTLRRRMPRST